MNEPIENFKNIKFKDVPSSFIPIKNDKEHPKNIDIDINKINKEYWIKKSINLFNDYQYGESFCKFGINKPSNISFFTRFSNAMKTFIHDEYSKRGAKVDELKPLLDILDNTLYLIADKMDKEELKEYNIESIISKMCGFLINYDNNNKTKERKNI